MTDSDRPVIGSLVVALDVGLPVEVELRRGDYTHVTDGHLLVMQGTFVRVAWPPGRWCGCQFVDVV